MSPSSRRLLFGFLVGTALCSWSWAEGPEGSSSSGPNSNSNSNVDEVCPSGESWCSALDEGEALALAAIRSLHRQLDDDQNGNIDLAESNEFLREELKYEKNIENRQKGFHQNDDTQVSVRELWETWRRSEVHNWTEEQTAEWVINIVGLPQIQEKFIAKRINGTVLPILAVNHNNFLQQLGVKDSITRQRICVKAMDVVLFGPPRDTSNRIKDVILTTLLAIAVIACYLVYKRYQWAQEDLSKMSKHMAELSKAEQTLLDLQKELEKARTQVQEKKETVLEGSNSYSGEGPEEMVKLKEEIMVLRSELHRAEVELQDKCWVPPPALQHWLQYTYELELKTYNKKKNGAEKQLQQAKDACDKLKKKRSSLMGAFVSTHGRSIDDVDKAILEARTALTEITHELQERMHRWKQVEVLIGCTIMNNPGIQYLENLLRVYGKAQSYSTGPGSVISNSQDDLDDDGASSIYCPSAVHKLISSSTYLMFPGPQNISHCTPASARVYSYHDPSSANPPAPSFGAVGNNGNARSSEACIRSCPNSGGDLGVLSGNQVSVPTSSHLHMVKSKSASSMISLRERSMRESSSKDSSAEDEALGDHDISARRVTFRADHRSRMKAFSNGRASGLFDSIDQEEARRVVTKALSQTHSTDSIASSKPEEKTPERKEEASSTEPELIKTEPPIIQNGNCVALETTSSASTPPELDTNSPAEPEPQAKAVQNGAACNGHTVDPNSPTRVPSSPLPQIMSTPKGKRKLWSTLTRMVHPSPGKLGEPKKISVNGNGTLGSGKKHRTFSGFVASLRLKEKSPPKVAEA